MSKKWNGQPLGVGAHHSPSKEIRDSHYVSHPRTTRTEYSDRIKSEAAAREIENKAAQKGKVKAHYHIIKEIYTYLEMNGEATFGRLARDLCIDIEAVEHVCKYLTTCGVAQLTRLQKRKTRMVRLKLMN